MTEPKKISRNAFAEFDGERWNAYVELLTRSELDELTPNQRSAYLAYWYSSEVLNGGHEQYFGNKEHFNHAEVVEALMVLGAESQADILRRALAFHQRSEKLLPERYDEFVVWNEDYGYSRTLWEFDRRFYMCRPELEADLLERYLDAHEAEFIEWIP